MGATLFSGIDAPEVSAPGIDWLWRAEIDKFPNAVSKHRRPDTPNLGDVSAPDFVERALQHGRPDVIVFGSPCQSFSVAGKRLGLDDPRGNLALVALEVVRQLRPRWLVFENVPGLFSSEKGRDFAAFLGAVEQCGYLGAWRVLDAQFTGVPQRRRRIFFVGHLGDWRPAAAVLFEQSSLQGHRAPRRETGKDVAPTISARTKGGGGLGTDFDLGGGIVPTLDASFGRLQGQDNQHINQGCGHFVTHSLRAEGFDASEDGTGRGTPLVVDTLVSSGDAHSGYRDEKGLVALVGCKTTGYQGDDVYSHDAPYWAPLSAAGGNNGGDAGGLLMQPAVAIQERAVSENPDTGPGGKGWRDDDTAYTVEARRVPQAVAFETRFARNGRGAPDTVVPPLKAQSGQTGKGDAAPCVVYPTLSANEGGTLTQIPPVQQGMQVRRLTPRECERLQGFPDDYTQIPWRGKAPDQCPDGPRYKALGNSMAVPVMRWILDRVQKVERLT